MNNNLPFTLRERGGFRYIDEGPATNLPPVVCLHGLLGGVANWASVVRTLTAHRYRVLVPVLPMYDLPMKESNVQGLIDHVRGFLQAAELGEVVLAGNSLGGQVAVFYALHHPESVPALILSGSSGVYEVEMGASTLRRRDRNFIRDRAARTFYDPVHVTDDLVEQAYEMVNNRGIALRLIRMARSAQAETITHQLSRIEAPTLLIWGRDDQITPPDVAQHFLEHLPHADLHFIDRCGHAPMMERPEPFNEMMLAFLRRTIGTPLPTPQPF